MVSPPVMNFRDRWRFRLDRWEFWVGVAYFAIVMTLVGLFVTYGKASREQTVRLAERRAAAQATYLGCIRSIPELHRVTVHLHGVNQLADVLVANTRAALAQTSRTDRLYEVRSRSLTRLVGAQKKIAAASSIPTPTVAQCEARRGALLAG